MPFLHGRSLEVTLTVPLSIYILFKSILSLPPFPIFSSSQYISDAVFFITEVGEMILMGNIRISGLLSVEIQFILKSLFDVKIGHETPNLDPPDHHLHCPTICSTAGPLIPPSFKPSRGDQGDTSGGWQTN